MLLLQLLNSYSILSVQDGQDRNSGAEDSSMVETSGAHDFNCHGVGARNFNSSWSGNRNKGTPDHLSENDEDLSDDESSSLSYRRKFARSGSYQEESAVGSGEDADSMCKEVRCIEMDDSSKGETADPLALSAVQNNGRGSVVTLNGAGDVEDEEIMSSLPQESSHLQTYFKSLDSPWSLAADMSSSGSLKLTRSRSCKANIMIGSSSPSFEMVQQSDNTPPPSQFTKNFPGRPPFSRRRIPPLNYDDSTAARLSRNDSQSSAGSAFVDELEGQNKVCRDEDIPSVDTFVAGMKEMAKLQYEKQLAENQVRM